MSSLASLLLLALSLLPSLRAFTPGFPYGREKIRGVNLGGWLVLEVWPPLNRSIPPLTPVSSHGSPLPCSTTPGILVSSTNTPLASSRTVPLLLTPSGGIGILGSPKLTFKLLPPRGMFLPNNEVWAHGAAVSIMSAFLSVTGPGMFLAGSPTFKDNFRILPKPSTGPPSTVSRLS